MLENKKIHNRHCSLSRKAYDQGSVDDTDEESEFYATVRGTATAVGMKSVARECGHEVNIASETDSLSGRDTSL